MVERSAGKLSLPQLKAAIAFTSGHAVLHQLGDLLATVFIDEKSTYPAERDNSQSAWKRTTLQAEVESPWGCVWVSAEVNRSGRF